MQVILFVAGKYSYIWNAFSSVLQNKPQFIVNY